MEPFSKIYIPEKHANAANISTQSIKIAVPVYIEGCALWPVQFGPCSINPGPWVF